MHDYEHTAYDGQFWLVNDSVLDSITAYLLQSAINYRWRRMADFSYQQAGFWLKPNRSDQNAFWCIQTSDLWK